jgi:hypothetical protein
MNSAPAFLLLLLIANGITVLAQDSSTILPVDSDTKLITYKEVVSETGTKAEFFNRAIAWINKEYKNPTNATKVRDPQTGLIEIYHRIELFREVKGTQTLSGTVDYNFKLELKDGRYRYTITNFNLRQTSRYPIERWQDKSDKQYVPGNEDFLKQIDNFTRKLIESLKQGMKPLPEKKPDEW